MTIVEIAVGVALLGLVAGAALTALTALNRNAVSTRVMTNAREIVQRNIESAMGVPFSTITSPTILALTGTSGATWDDDGGGDGLEKIYTNRSGTTLMYGTLTRTVVAQANPAGADIRKVTFHLDYTLFDRAMSYEMTTIRAMDK
jgi:type II secretory pathway pseudopilin PulG